MMKQNKGITLIALVITIIVMLILVSATINLSINGGLFSYAGKAVSEQKIAKEKEKIYMALLGAMANENTVATEITATALENELNWQGELVEVADRGKYFVVTYKDNNRKYKVTKKDTSIEPYDSSTFKGLGGFPEKKDLIKSVQFVKYINIPEGAYNEDLSVEQNGSIMGWIEQDSEDTEMYNLYVGSNNQIIVKRSCSQLFQGWGETKSIYFENFDTYDVTNMVQMFTYCSKLEEVDVENLEVDNVTNMFGIFWGCSKIEGVFDLSEWSIENVTNIGNAFVNLGASEIIMPGKNNVVVGIGAMFQGCKASKIDISGINTFNVKSMTCIFHDCPNLMELDIRNFEFDNVTNKDFFINYKSRPDAVVYVKDKEAQEFVLSLRSGWTAEKNVIIKGK